MFRQQLKPDFPSRLRGQALIEYALILVLAFIGLIAVLALTTPVVGNVFSYTVYNLLGQTTTPQEPLSVGEFWDQVTAVASFTPETVNLITNTPLPSTVVPSPVPSNTPTPMTPSPTPSDTHTPGPSPTPSDQDYGYPFNDDGTNEDNWQTDSFPDLFEENGPWAAEYWHSNNNNPGGCNNGSQFNATTGTTSRPPQATAQVDKIFFPNPDNPVNYWQTTGDRPHPSVNTDFCSRFENTFYVPAGTYRVIYRHDDGVRVYVIDSNGNTRIINDWNYIDDNYREYEWNNTVSENKTFRIVHRDTGGAARLEVRLEQSSLSSDDNCTWDLSDERPRTPPSSWDDSPYAEYQNNQHCTLRLRGTINLAGATRPHLEFWEAYELDASNDKVIVAIAVDGTDVWNEKVLHTSTTNYAYTRQTIDLTSFTGSQGTVNYAGQRIELSFTIDTDGNFRGDGWWIDDIRVYEKPDRVFTIGFADNVEGEIFWVNQSTWARTAEKARSGIYAWSDSPSTNYALRTENILELDGRLDLTQGVVNRPEIAFWHSWNLNSGDYIYVEISGDRENWVALRTGPTDPTDWLEGPGVENNFVEASAEIPAPYSSSTHVYVRFRLSSNTSAIADGWYIDDIEFRNKPLETVSIGWCDNMETGTANWLPEGSWALTNTQRYDGLYSWTDSPGGNYAHNTNNSLVLKPYIDLSASTTRPVLEFWSIWNLRDASNTSDKIYVEVSPNEGVTWTTVWAYVQNWDSRLPGWGTTIPAGYRYNGNMGWYRSTVELSSLPALVAPAVGYQLRFRLDALTSSNVSDGWYIDAVCIKDYVPPVYVPPMADDLEAGSFNWIVMGDWKLSSEAGRSPTTGFHDSPGTNYRHRTFNLLELSPTIDLGATTEPTLYYWEKYDLTIYDYVFVHAQAVTVNGVPLTNWEVLPLTTHYNEANLGWVRTKADLKPFLASGYRYIRLRFELDALDDAAVDDGWWLDNISIIDNVNEVIYEVPYLEDGEVLSPGEWIFGHEWDTVEVYRNLGSGGALGPGQWQATWFDGISNGCTVNAGLTNQMNTTTVDEINYSWGSGFEGGVGLTGGNTWGARFTRNFLFAQDSTFTFTGVADDGVKITINGVEFYRSDRWNNCTSSTSYESGPYTFLGGVPYVVQVEYYDNTGTATFTFGFSGPSKVFHESPGGNYQHLTDNILELEGLIDLSGTANPVLFWEHRYNIGGGDYISIEVSTDKGFTWTSIYSRWGSTTDWNWSQPFIDLTGYAGQQIGLRLRLNALATWDASVADGWWIDNIRVVE